MGAVVGGTHHGTHRQVGHIMIVHDVEMNPVGAGRHHLGGFLAEAGEVGGQQAGGDAGGGQFGHGEKSSVCVMMTVLQRSF